MATESMRHENDDGYGCVRLASARRRSKRAQGVRQKDTHCHGKGREGRWKGVAQELGIGRTEVKLWRSGPTRHGERVNAEGLAPPRWWEKRVRMTGIRKKK
eukprot:5117444-Pleurochrysis_carterae.AAC.1